jgi:FSR family fosmidomycin resistance protein-like MFS transporter
MTRRSAVLLFAAHFLVDAYAGVLGPLAAWIELSPTYTGILGFLYTVSTSSTQLVFGMLADRGYPRRLIAGGLFVSAAALSFSGAGSGSLVTLTTLLLIGGLGVSAFHPASVVAAGDFGKERRALAVSWFLAVGIFGFAIGPLIYVGFLERFGLDATPYLAIPGLIVAALLASPLLDGVDRRVATSKPAAERVKPPIVAADEGVHASRSPRGGTGRSEIFVLFIMVVARSAIFIAFVTFLPALARDLGLGSFAMGAVPMVFTLGGAAGTLVYGALGSSRNRRTLQVQSVVFGTAACYYIATSLDASPWAVYPALAVAGFFVGSTTSLHVAMGQELAAGRASTVSSLLMGFGFGFGSAASLLVGEWAERASLESALAWASFIGVLTLPIVPLVRPYGPGREFRGPGGSEDRPQEGSGALASATVSPGVPVIAGHALSGTETSPESVRS